MIPNTLRRIIRKKKADKKKSKKRLMSYSCKTCNKKRKYTGKKPEECARCEMKKNNPKCNNCNVEMTEFHYQENGSFFPAWKCPNECGNWK